MTPERPDWWPRALWPGGGRRREPPGGLPDPAPGPEGGERPPGASFLEAVAAAFGAEVASVYRLDRERAVWVVERRAGDAAGTTPEELPAAGHPLTWCVREEIVMQVEAGELLDGRRGGWALAGAAPAADLALVVLFGGSPPAGARAGMGAAVDHLAALHEAGVL